MASATSHPVQAGQFVANSERAHWHDQTLWFVRAKRDKAASALPEWEELRERASQIKRYTMSHLADLLEQFERNAVRAGARVHWAKDAAEHNDIVLKLLQDRGVTKLVKSKSMLTEECHLNPYLERHGIEVVDTDLGEWIVQLRNEPPSHIVMPAIHTKREEIGELFHEKIGTQKGATDPQYLTESARRELRRKFLAAEAGITGVNFAIAETGGLIGAVMWSPAVRHATRPDLDAYLDHVDHMVRVGGIEHVGFASDITEGQAPGPEAWDKSYGPHGYSPTITGILGSWYVYETRLNIDFQSLTHTPRIWEGLRRRGYSEDAIDRLRGGNWRRVLTEVWGN